MRAVKWFLTMALAAASPVLAHKPTVTTFTYHDDVLPIFAAKCGTCHREGGVAPMSLLSYQEAKPWAVSIKNELLNLAMPPWYADERYGEFKHRSALSAKEMDTVVDWCLGGSPEGEPAAMSSSQGGAGEWMLGEPDLTLSMPEAVELDADTSEATQELTIPTGLERERYLRAIDFRPGSANIVRSVMFRVSGDAQPLGAWIPGQVPESLPPDRGRRIPADAEITLVIHYEKTWLDDGSPVTDQSVLGLYFHESEAPRSVRTVAVDPSLPHDVEQGAELVALLPVVDASVEDIAAELVLPDGTRERLIRLFHPNPDWPRKYWLREPRSLPAGSRVEVSVTGDEAVSPVVLLDIVPQ